MSIIFPQYEPSVSDVIDPGVLSKVAFSLWQKVYPGRLRAFVNYLSALSISIFASSSETSASIESSI